MKVILAVRSATNDVIWVFSHPRTHQFECVDCGDLNQVLKNDLCKLLRTPKNAVARGKLVKNIPTTHKHVARIYCGRPSEWLLDKCIIDFHPSKYFNR